MNINKRLENHHGNLVFFVGSPSFTVTTYSNKSGNYDLNADTTYIIFTAIGDGNRSASISQNGTQIYYKQFNGAVYQGAGAKCAIMICANATTATINWGGAAYGATAVVAIS